MGFSCHKIFLDELYQNRQIVAVTDLPSHLKVLKSNIGNYWSADIEDIIYHHTLFPLYAPFIGQLRKSSIFEAMQSDSGVGVHTRIGMVASKVQPPSYLRYCPLCNVEMKNKYGESYWRRDLQISGIIYCPKHHCELLNSSVKFRVTARHEYIASSGSNCREISSGVNQSGKIAELGARVKSLLFITGIDSPSLWQWNHFYHQLAKDIGAINGQKILHDELRVRMLAYWQVSFLARFKLHQLSDETSWLHALFQKHRKSFAYLQHLLVWQALGLKLPVLTILQIANQYPDRKLSFTSQVGLPSEKIEVEYKRVLWSEFLKKHSSIGIAATRKLPSGAKLYIWLYRHDREWLLLTNKQFRICPNHSERVDWCKRDRSTVIQLFKIIQEESLDLEGPRLTRNFLLKKLPHSSTIERNLYRLPLCKEFFIRYVESLVEYQIRRITIETIKARLRGVIYRRWELERHCGLDRNRLPKITESFIQWIEDTNYAENTFQKNT